MTTEVVLTDWQYSALMLKIDGFASSFLNDFKLFLIVGVVCLLILVMLSTARFVREF